MSNNFGFKDIILLAMIAGFIILRLRSILGRKTGYEEKIYPGFVDKKFETPKESASPQNNIDPLTKSLEGRERSDFLKGAEVAYETIVTSFAKGDKKKLSSLLTRSMNENFEKAINERNKNGITSELTFIGMKKPELEKFEKIKNEFIATVKFVSEIISVKKDKDNKILEGNPDRIKTVTDHWKFTKNIFSKNPNWYLAEIVSD